MDDVWLGRRLRNLHTRLIVGGVLSLERIRLDHLSWLHSELVLLSSFEDLPINNLLLKEEETFAWFLYHELNIEQSYLKRS